MKNGFLLAIVRVVCLAAAVLASASCVPLPTGGFGVMIPSGEHFAYGYYKADLGEIEEVKAVTNNGGRAFSPAGLGSDTKVIAHPSLIDVNEYERQQIPAWVEVRWRKLPPPGAESYTGEPVGPFRVAVRERIPKDVLELVHGARNERVHLVFMIRNDGVDFRWELWDYQLHLKDGKAILLRSSPETYPHDSREESRDNKNPNQGERAGTVDMDAYNAWLRANYGFSMVR